MNTSNKKCIASFAASWLLVCSSAIGNTLFFDDFSGPTLDSNWQALLPTMNVATPDAGSTQSTAFLGGPNYSFQSLGADSVLRVSNMLNIHQRRGWSSVGVYDASDFRYEVRFNTLNQSSVTSIDAFIEIGIIDAANPSRYDITSPYGGFFSNFRQFAAGGSVDGSYTVTDAGYQNNTWYRLVLEAAPGQHIRASILSDSGVELAGRSLGHGVEAFPSGFKLFLSQAMGEPIPVAEYPVDVAIDFAKLTCVPEPSTCTLLLCAALAGRFAAIRRKSAFDL